MVGTKSIDRYTLFFAAAAAFMMIGHLQGGKTVRDALFLSNFDVTELPKTISGKIRRGQLKKKEWAKELKRRPSYAYMGSEAKLVGSTIGETLRDIVERHPDNEALVAPFRDVCMTYRQFLDVCSQAAKSFLKLGVQKGDRVAIWATNYPEWVITQFATSMIGAILVTVNPAYRSHELEYGLKDSETQTLVLIEKFKTSESPGNPQLIKTHIPHAISTMPTTKARIIVGRFLKIFTGKL